MNSMINLKLFGYADSQDVIVGKEGWYFFAGGMSLYDALGTQPFYPRRILISTDTLSLSTRTTSV